MRRRNHADPVMFGGKQDAANGDRDIFFITKLEARAHIDLLVRVQIGAIPEGSPIHHAKIGDRREVSVLSLGVLDQRVQ